MNTTKVQITHGADTYILSANFADAASPILLDGEATPYQVADARHRLQDAVTLVMDWVCSQSGDEMEGSWVELDTDDPRRGPLVTPAAEECSEDEASACVLYRNTYHQGMEDWEPRSFHPSIEDAEKAIEEDFRRFRAANSDNSYGPEWTIGVRNDSGAWVPMEDAE